jgi:hypothetical protein
MTMMTDDEIATLQIALLGAIAVLLAVIASTLLFGGHITLIVFGGLAALAVLIAVWGGGRENLTALAMTTGCAVFLVGMYFWHGSILH